jgi:redox-sensitive bicupin YhaK (pirin superfamily)
MRRFLSLITIGLVLLGVAALGARLDASAQDAFKRGESVFTNATAELLAVGTLPSSLPQPAELALQRVRIAPGGHIVTPGDDPRVTLIYVERGTLTVRNTVPTQLTRGAVMATPGAEAQEAIPAETEFTMSAGDANLSPAGSGGELRNEGTEEVILLAGLIVPVPDGAATPGAGTPVP